MKLIYMQRFKTEGRGQESRTDEPDINVNASYYVLAAVSSSFLVLSSGNKTIGARMEAPIAIATV